MTFLIGGTPRSGKTTLKDKLLKEHLIPGFCTDYLREAFQYGVPSFGIKEGMEKDEEKSEILWPFFRGLIIARKTYDDPLLIEGTNFLPKYLAEFKDEPKIRICFLGYANVSAEKKFREIRENPSPAGEWTREISDMELHSLVREFLEISRYFRDECARYGLQYFDTGDDFAAGINRAADFLLA